MSKPKLWTEIHKDVIKIRASGAETREDKRPVVLRLTANHLTACCTAVNPQPFNHLCHRWLRKVRVDGPLAL